jgi:DNA (cytosine-5)-methyltransferase 1
MGFEKPRQAEWKIPVSDTQAYRQFGNAVVVPVVSAVAQLMQPRIFDAMELDGREVPATMQAQLPLSEPGIAAE